MNCKNFNFGKIVGSALLLAAASFAAPRLRAQEGRKVLANPPAAYPEVAKRLHLSGVVKVQVVIAPDGKITDVKLIGGHPLFVDSVQEALKNWKYAPASSETKTVLEFSFHP